MLSMMWSIMDFCCISVLPDLFANGVIAGYCFRFKSLPFLISSQLVSHEYWKATTGSRMCSAVTLRDCSYSSSSFSCIVGLRIGWLEGVQRKRPGRNKPLTATDEHWMGQQTLRLNTISHC